MGDARGLRALCGEHYKHTEGISSLCQTVLVSDLSTHAESFMGSASRVRTTTSASIRPCGILSRHAEATVILSPARMRSAKVVRASWPGGGGVLGGFGGIVVEVQCKELRTEQWGSRSGRERDKGREG